MFGSAFLEVAIGIIFIYLLVSVIRSSIREGIEAWLKTRAAYLEYGLRVFLFVCFGLGFFLCFFVFLLFFCLFPGEYHVRKRLDEPRLFARGFNLPSYIPSRNFALALLDTAARGPRTVDLASSTSQAPVVSLEAVRQGVANIQNPAVQRVLLSAIDQANGSLRQAQAILEAWYDSGMDRVSGWFKRSTQKVLFLIALIVAVGLNVDTIKLAGYLYSHDAQRAVVVASASASPSSAQTTGERADEARQRLEDLQLPIGWTHGWDERRISDEQNASPLWNLWIGPILGWLMTAFAATMGAPFWFDVLNKVMVIRSTVKPHEKSPEEASQDRQTPVQRFTADQIPRSEAPPQPAWPATVAAHGNSENDVDGCGVGSTVGTTPDDMLPLAKGGVGP